MRQDNEQIRDLFGIKRQPEADRDTQAEELADFLEKVGVDEVFASEESKRDFITRLDFESFKKLLVTLNGILRDVSKKDRSIDGEGIVVYPYIPPRGEDKEGLLEKSFDALQRMNSAGRSFEDIAVLSSVSVNAIHAFAGANGRTSRLSYYLLYKNHPNFETERPILKDILAEDGRGLIDVTTHSIASDLNKFIAGRYLGMDLSNPATPTSFTHETGDHRLNAIKALGAKVTEFDYEDTEFIQNLVISPEGYSLGHGVMAVTKFLTDHGTLNNYTKTNQDSEGRITGSGILIAHVIKNLSREDVREIEDDYWEIKRVFIQALIESIEKPENYIIDEGTERAMSVLDYLKLEIQETSKLPSADETQTS